MQQLLRAGILLLVPAATGVIASEAVGAQEAPDSQGIKEIVVTAQRVESNLQSTPIAVSAFSQDDLVKLGVINSTDIAAHTPSLTIGGDGQLGTTPIVLRGIGVVDPNGNTQDNPVAIYVDDVYLSRPYSNIFLLPDIQRVEVLRGPQGTLFGRNASAGAVHFVTVQPRGDFDASVESSYGSFNTAEARGYVLAPVGDGWGVKLAAALSSADGWAFNSSNQERFAGGHSSIVRGSLHFSNDERDFVIQADHSASTDKSHFVNVALFPSQPINVNTTNSPHNEDRSNTTVSIKLDEELGFAKATVVAAYVQSRDYSNFDSDSSALDLVNLSAFDFTGREYSLEARLASDSSGPLTWISGVYLYAENDLARGDIDLGSAITGGSPVVLNRLDNESRTRSAAVFANATQAFSELFSLTGGLRYTHDRKSLLGRNLLLPDPVKVDDADAWNDVSPRLIATLNFSKDVMAYASASKGFRSGTWSVTTDDPTPAKPETVWNYEVGLKSEFWDKRARLNVAAFYEDFKNKQEQVVVRVGVTSERNATSAKIQGFEAEVELLPVRHFHISGTVSLLHTKYGTFIGSPQDVGPGESFIYSGNQLPFAPKVQASLVPSYSMPVGAGALTLQGEWLHQSSVFFTRINDPIEGNRGYNDYNVRLTWDGSEKWSVGVYGTNLSGERHPIQIQPFLNQGLGLPTQFNEPRKFGGQFTYRY